MFYLMLIRSVYNEVYEKAVHPLSTLRKAHNHSKAYAAKSALLIMRFILITQVKPSQRNAESYESRHTKLRRRCRANFAS